MFTISCSESLLCLLGVTHLHSHSSVKAVASDSSSATSPSLSVLTVKKTPPDSLVVREVVLDLEAWENVIVMRFLVVSQWINKNQGEIDSDSKMCWETFKCDRKDWCRSTLYLLMIYKLSVLEVPTWTTSIQTRSKKHPLPINKKHPLLVWVCHFNCAINGRLPFFLRSTCSIK